MQMASYCRCLPQARVLHFDDWILLLKHLCFFDEAFQQREGTSRFTTAPKLP
jgi:hypothetical protein